MLYLDVPFQDKDEAKKLGAWWDTEKKNGMLKIKRIIPNLSDGFLVMKKRYVFYAITFTS